MFTQVTTEWVSIMKTAGLNLSYASVSILIGIIAMVVGYTVFDRLTPFNTAKILEKNPLAVGIFNAGIVLSIGICAGLIIGLSCN